MTNDATIATAWTGASLDVVSNFETCSSSSSSSSYRNHGCHESKAVTAPVTVVFAVVVLQIDLTAKRTMLKRQPNVTGVLVVAFVVP